MKLGDAVARVSAALLGFAVVFTLLPWTPWIPLWRALLVPWRLHAAVASLLVVVVLALLRRRNPALAWLVIAAANGLWVPPFALPLGGSAPPRTDSAHAGVRLLAWNVYADHTEFDAVVDAIRLSRPDVVALTEVRQELVDRLATEGMWPYRHFEPGHYEGMGVLSRHPIASVKLERPAEPLRFPALDVALDVRGVPLSLLVVHAATPMTDVGRADRDGTLRWLGERARSAPHALIVAGDLNLTAWTSEFRALTADGSLTAAGAWRQIGPTWPCWLGPLGIPIDHVLTGRDAHVVAVTRSPCGPSDHHGVLALVELWRPEPAR